ncbi:MAG: XdhC family protein [Oligoflexales bacterium]
MYDENLEIYEKVDKWISRDLKTAVATVINTWKSAPRPVGSQLAVNQNLEFVGSLSGGCIEREVIEEAMGVIADGQARTLSFGISHQDALESGLACGGSIKIYVELVKPEIKLIRQGLLERRNFALLTDLSEGKTEYFDSNTRTIFGSMVLCDATKEKMMSGTNGFFEKKDKQYFIKSCLKPLSLYIVGAVHISQALIPMAKIAGFEPTLIDPRSTFASQARFPNTNILCKWPEEAFPEIKLDERSAVIVLSHDPKFDDPSLEFALSSNAFYIGALGSKKSQKARLERLSLNGFSNEQLKRIHGPIGLDIGAKTSSHIAVAIIAELISCINTTS